jgi:hypothetical protein
MNDLAKSIAATILKLREDQSGAKAAFEAAVRNFEKAKMVASTSSIIM